MAHTPELKRKLSTYPASPSAFPRAATRGPWASLFATIGLLTSGTQEAQWITRNGTLSAGGGKGAQHLMRAAAEGVTVPGAAGEGAESLFCC